MGERPCPNELVKINDEWHLYYFVSDYIRPNISVWSEQFRNMSDRNIIALPIEEQHKNFSYFKYKNNTYAYYQVQFWDFDTKTENSIFELYDVLGNKRVINLHYLLDNDPPQITIEAPISDKTGEIEKYYEQKNSDIKGVTLKLSDNDKVDDYTILSDVDGVMYGSSFKEPILLKGSPSGIQYNITATDSSSLTSKKTIKVYEDNCNVTLDFTKVFVYLPYVNDIPSYVYSQKQTEEEKNIPRSNYTKLDVTGYSFIPSRNLSLLITANIDGDLGFAENGLDVIYYIRSNQSSYYEKITKNIPISEGQKSITAEIDLFDYLDSYNGISMSNNQIILRAKDRFGNCSYSVLEKPVDYYSPAAKIVSTDEKNTYVVQEDIDLYNEGFGHIFTVYYSGTKPNFQIDSLNDTYFLNSNEQNILNMESKQPGVGPYNKVRQTISYYGWYNGKTGWHTFEDDELVDITSIGNSPNGLSVKTNGISHSYSYSNFEDSEKYKYKLTTYDLFGNNIGNVTIKFKKVSTENFTFLELE